MPRITRRTWPAVGSASWPPPGPVSTRARDGPARVARAVGAEAGISTGALYHHFAGLDALWAELAEQRAVTGIAAAAARAPAGEDPLSWAVRALVCAPPLGVPERPAGRVRAPPSTRCSGRPRRPGPCGPGSTSRPSPRSSSCCGRRSVVGWPRTASRTDEARLAGALTTLIEVGVRPATNG